MGGGGCSGYRTVLRVRYSNHDIGGSEIHTCLQLTRIGLCLLLPYQFCKFCKYFIFYQHTTPLPLLLLFSFIF